MLVAAIVTAAAILTFSSTAMHGDNNNHGCDENKQKS